MLKKRVTWIITLFVLAQASAVLADQVTDRAKLLMQQKNPSAALQLLAPLEAQRAGEVEFDYLLGIAALDAGDAQQAVFALERALAVNPNHLQARAEIARAYMILGERDNARREFLSVRNQNPPEAVKETIDRLLSVLERGPTRLTGYAEIGMGMDSNVNNATGSGQIAIPAFGGGIATLAPGAVRQGDNFTSLAAGFGLVHGLSPEWALLAGLGASLKLNNDNSQFDTDTLDGNIGARWSRDKEAVTLGYQLQTFSVDNTRFRDTNGIVAQWQHSYSETRQATAFVQMSDLSYPTQPVRDARRTVIGIAWAEGLGGPRNPVVFGSLYMGEEREQAASVQHLGHKPFGIRIGGQMTLTPQVTLFANASREERHYGGQEPLFLVARNDTQTDLRVGVNYVPTRGWTLTPQFSFTDNQSNITLNKYTRTVASVTLRREF
jgi:tetratricopeptide (TPR) repeat protein